jgi:hypothetical protein
MVCRRQYQFALRTISLKLRSESDQKLRQKQDNNSVKADPEVQLKRQVFFSLLRYSHSKKKQLNVHQQYRNIEKLRIVTKPIVRGAFREPEKHYCGNLRLNKFRLCFALKVFWVTIILKLEVKS